MRGEGLTAQADGDLAQGAGQVAGAEQGVDGLGQGLELGFGPLPGAGMGAHPFRIPRVRLGVNLVAQRLECGVQFGEAGGEVVDAGEGVPLGGSWQQQGGLAQDPAVVRGHQPAFEQDALEPRPGLGGRHLHRVKRGEDGADRVVGRLQDARPLVQLAVLDAPPCFAQA